MLTTQDFWEKKFTLVPEDKIASAGSCFAQHISRRLATAGYDFLDVEPAPQGLPPEKHQKYGYGVYSGRYGNIYTSRQLLELAEEATGARPSLDYSWEKDGRYFDPLRPGVEPSGLSSHEEVMHHRAYHLRCLRDLLQQCDVFVFTFGLTETWICERSGRALPVAPGTIAGDYDPDLYKFHNLTHAEVLADMQKFMQLMDDLRPEKPRRYLFTVSPVPLTATATAQHVLPATTYSKSVLRAVAGELAQSSPDIDYFPSYEVISSHWSRGHFFAPNLRSVLPAGVSAAMRIFFQQHAAGGAPDLPETQHQTEKSTSGSSEDAGADDLMCEEALLAGFGQ
ncbi:MAG: GSCFA domain-containing protein [Sulfitobacter sp.]